MKKQTEGLRIQKWSVEDICAKAGGPNWNDSRPLCWTQEQVRETAKDLGITEPIDAKQALDCLQWKIEDSALLRLLCLMLPLALAAEWAPGFQNFRNYFPIRNGRDMFCLAFDGTDLEPHFERLAQILDKVQS